MSSLPDEVTLRPDESTVLRLPGRSGAGYTWEAEVEDAKIASASVSFEDLTASGGLVADELVTMTGLRPGTTSVRLLQRRRWEHEGTPIAEHRLTLTVVAPPERPRREGG